MGLLTPVLPSTLPLNLTSRRVEDCGTSHPLFRTSFDIGEEDSLYINQEVRAPFHLHLPLSTPPELPHATQRAIMVDIQDVSL